jgi:hypothetical protein
MPDGTAQVVYKRDGKVVARQIRQFAVGGRQMTIQCQFFSRAGRWVDRVLIFEKHRKGEEQ